MNVENGSASSRVTVLLIDDQPLIGEAVRRVGPERILFGSDWPFIGNNIIVGRDRVRDCVNTGMLNQDQAKLILGENAVKLLGIKVDAN